MTGTVKEARKKERVAAPSARPAVSIDHVSKTFRIPREQAHTLKERVLHPMRFRQFESLRAVQDVAVDIAPGEFFGIVGRNGSGKSTLLKCLAGIYKIDRGSVSIEGRLSPFIELGVGFNMDLKARDNVIINAIMLGLSRREARERYEDIIAFAELKEFVELKLKNFSSGMLVRLAFATAIQVDADILLIDEVLAVGDAAFQQKCFDEFGRLQRAGRTILFVTHDMTAVQRFCDRAMLLNRGEVVEIGDPGSIARHYNQLNFEDAGPGIGEGAARDGAAAHEVAEVVDAWFESREGKMLVTAEQGERCYIRMDVRFRAPVDDPVFAFSLENESGNVAFATSTNLQNPATGHFEPGSNAFVRVGFENWLGPGHYRLIASVVRAGPGADAFDMHATASIIVSAEHAGGGMADLPNIIEIDRR